MSWFMLMIIMRYSVTASYDNNISHTDETLDHKLSKYLPSLNVSAITESSKRNLEGFLKIFTEVLFAGGVENYERELEQGRELSRDEDSKRNVSELITSKGYSCEEHTAQTVDGYLLSIQRVGPSTTTKATLENDWRNKTKPVVVLQHGLMDSSATWVINQADNSLGFMLADAGFDVWISNSRGNKYSKTNINFDRNNPKFWDFSWDEMAKYDLPAIIDYITGATNASQIYYVGHSQGSLIAFTGFSCNTTLASRIKQIFALSPVLYAGHSKAAFREVVQLLCLYYDFLTAIGFKIVPSTSFSSDTESSAVCRRAPLLCEKMTMTMSGVDYYGYNKTRADVYFSHLPSGESMKELCFIV
ncbi:gastric triacylglycerol lipase-like [Convolutriloba macropyga]|uniref:gastric triacylglycerol lipase-like n=1 Tax=Convolutriloba macropyga TaxID=536237 RepID=UPI003F51EE8C